MFKLNRFYLKLKYILNSHNRMGSMGDIFKKFGILILLVIVLFCFIFCIINCCSYITRPNQRERLRRIELMRREIIENELRAIAEYNDTMLTLKNYLDNINKKSDVINYDNGNDRCDINDDNNGSDINVDNDDSIITIEAK